MSADGAQQVTSVGRVGQVRWEPNDVRNLVFIAFAWTLIGLLVGLRGEFPLNDDWSYSLAAQSLVDEHDVRFSDFTSMPLLVQLLWSWLFTAPFGFSFTALRISTWVLGGVAGLAFYAGARQLGARPVTASVAAAVTMANPLFVGLSATFMTDVPFLALFMVSVAATLRGLALRSAMWIAAGVVAAIAATLVRQLGLALLVGMVPAIVLAWGAPTPRRIAIACLPAVLGVATLIGFQEVVDAMHRLPAGYRYRTDGLFALLRDVAAGHLGALRTPIANVAISALYAGLLLLGPALAALPMNRIRFVRLLLGTAIGTAASIASGHLMPMTGNILLDLGIGPRTLAGDVAPAPVAVWWIVTALCWLGVIALLELLAAQVRPLMQTLEARRYPALAPWAFLLSSGLVYFVPIASQYGAFFDRYLLPVLALAGLGIAARGWSARGVALASALTLVIGVASVCLTHDYLAWNRVRWEVASELESRFGLDPRQIDGGFEYTGLRDERARRAGRGPAEGPPSAVISQSPTDGMAAVVIRDVVQWAPWGVERIFGLRSVAPAGPALTDAPNRRAPD